MTGFLRGLHVSAVRSTFPFHLASPLSQRRLESIRFKLDTHSLSFIPGLEGYLALPIIANSKELSWITVPYQHLRHLVGFHGHLPTHSWLNNIRQLRASRTASRRVATKHVMVQAVAWPIKKEMIDTKNALGGRAKYSPDAPLRGAGTASGSCEARWGSLCGIIAYYVY